MSKVICLSDPEDRKAPPKRYTVEIRQHPKLFWDLCLETDSWDEAEAKYMALCNDPAYEKAFIRIVDREAGE